MGEVKRYDEERDIEQLDILGGYYGRHVSAMTSEGLYRKYAIAAELGYRDSVIDALRAENAKLAAALESIDTLVSEVIGADSGDRRILGKIEDEISAAIAKHRGE